MNYKKSPKLGQKQTVLSTLMYSENNISIKKANGDQTFVIRKQQDLKNIPVKQQSVNIPTQSTF